MLFRSAGDAYTAAVGAATTAAALGTVHGGAGASFVNPSFTVDLKDLKISHAANGKATITVAGQTLTSASLGAAGTADAATVASKIAAAYTGTNASHTVTIVGLGFKVTAAGSKLTFTHCTATGATATAITASKADAFNAAIKGATVQVTGAKRSEERRVGKECRL